MLVERLVPDLSMGAAKIGLFNVHAMAACHAVVDRHAVVDCHAVVERCNRYRSSMLATGRRNGRRKVWAHVSRDRELHEKHAEHRDERCNEAGLPGGDHLFEGNIVKAWA